MCGTPTDNNKILGKRLNRHQGKSPQKKVAISTTVARCSNCGLIYSNPQPIPVDLQDHYGVPPEEYWSKEYFVIDENYFGIEIQRAKQLIDFRPGKKALDIGAGLGKCMLALEKAGFDVYGIEPSVPFHERAISRMNISSERLQNVMIENAEFPNESFDFITFSVVLEHLYDPSSAINKALTWLKPNGIIHIEVPSAVWVMNKLINLFYLVRGLDYVGNLSPMHEPYHLYEFSLKSFEEHGKKNGYTVAFHEYYACTTYTPAIIDRMLRYYMKKTDKGMQLCVWLRKQPPI
jgi:2-polyprenyl-3-methyl-5-hydroxy-6-metoxy-1,4-benzoquinol methylase